MRVLLALIILVLLPSSAMAQAAAYGTIVVLKDRQAGFLEDVRRVSRQVTVVSNGIETPATPGMAVFNGDAVRTTEGTCVVETPAGFRVEIAERSQVRLAPTVLQRLGEVFYSVQGAFRVDVGDVQLLVEGTAFKVSNGLDGAGNLAVTEGTVKAKSPGNEEPAAADTTLDFTQEAAGAVRAMTPQQVAAIQAWRAQRFEPSPVAGLQRNRMHIRFAGGIGRLDEFSWGQFGLEARVRAIGPLWFDLGAELALRPADELGAYETVLALPLHVGARLVADLPGAVFLGGGADFTVAVGEHCVDAPTCRREVTAEPGVRLTMLGGLLLGQNFGVDLEFGGGVTRRRFPPIAGSEPVEVPDPNVRFAVGAFVRF
jgi:hypothetical protein